MNFTPSLELLALGIPAVMFVGFLFHAFRARARLEFRIQLLEVLAAGVRQRLPLAPLLEESADGLPTYHARTAVSIAAALREGAPLGEALATEAAPWFPEHVTQAIRTGAGTARLATMLELLAEDVDKVMASRHRFVMALLYPALVGGLLVFVAWYWLATSVHVIVSSIGQTLPNWSMALALTIWAAATLLLLLHAASAHGHGSDLASRVLAALLPPIRRARRLLFGERLLRGVGLMVQAGMSLPAAMRSCATTLGDARAERQAQDAAWLMECGEPAHEALARAPLPAFAAVRAAAALRADRDTVCRRLRVLSAECATRSQAAYDRLISLVNPVALLLVGLALVGMFQQLFLCQAFCLQEVMRPW